jgi:hypothetical protein
MHGIFADTPFNQIGFVAKRPAVQNQDFKDKGLSKFIAPNIGGLYGSLTALLEHNSIKNTNYPKFYI